MILQLAAVGIGSANEATKMSSYGQVQSFDMASAHKSRLGASATYACYRPCNPTHGTHPIGSGYIGSRVELNQLGEMHANVEVRVHCVHVSAKPIGRELKNAFGSRPEIAHKLPSAIGVSIPDVMRNDELRFAVHSNPRPRTAPFWRGIAAQPLFVASNKAVEFVGLDQVRLNPANQAIKQPLALVSRREHEIENRSDVQSRQSGDRTHAHTFHHQLKRTRSRVQIGVVGFEPFDRLRKSGFAGLAAPALNAALTEVTELFAVLMLAFQAGHIRRCFLADVALKFAWVGIAGHSACRLPRLSVSADGGACLVRWARQGLNLQPTDSKSVALGQFELRTHKGDVQGLAPLNVPSLNASCRTSDRHAHSPFAWIGHLKSFPVFPNRTVGINRNCTRRREVCLVVGVGGLPVGGHAFGESIAALNQPCEGSVKYCERIGISAYVHSHVCKPLHYFCGCESGSRLRHKNLPTQVRKASRWRDAFIVSQRRERSDCLFELLDSLSSKRQLRLSLFQLLLSRQIARFVWIDRNVGHDTENV